MRKIIANISSNLIILNDQKFASVASHVLGGVPKAGLILKKQDNISPDDLASILFDFCNKGQKFHFGLSAYGDDKISQAKLKALGLEIKKILKSRGLSVRLVESKSFNLSSVDVVKNKLLDKGVELCLMFFEDWILIGKTESVQPFGDYSARDFDRPARDMKRGMIPPKLGRSMINMCAAKKGDLILDPFCGIGTILQEAFLMGYKAVGTDIDEKAIKDSQKNIEWLIREASKELEKPRIEQVDVRNLDKILTSNSVDAIVTEFDLGPRLQGDETREKIQEIERSLSKFYFQALQMIQFVLKERHRAVVAWPYFVKQEIVISVFDKLKDFGLRVVEPYPEPYSKLYPLTGRGTLLYGREGQNVFREILILEKIK